MSSDSEDDIFGNAAKKLKILCSKSSEIKKNNFKMLSDCTEIKNDVSTSSPFNSLITDIQDHVKSRKQSDYPSDLSNDSDADCFEAIDRSVKGRKKIRQSKRVSSKKAISKKSAKVTKMSDSNLDNSLTESLGSRKRTKKKTKPTNLHQTQNTGSGDKISSLTNTSNNLSQSIDIINTLGSPTRGRNRRRGRSRHVRGGCYPIEQSHAIPQNLPYPTYNIGNTDEYPDKSESIPLFSSKPNIINETPNIENEIILSDSDLDENEELSVHVHWQNYEVFKFNIRRFQKIKEIFEFFAKKENVPEKRLFFAYNDVVLTCDDTPDSMKYNIAKFIEGGIISNDLINLVREHTSNKPRGIQIKFQCQNIKRPYEVSVQPTDKLSIAIVKCAEHFEKSLHDLKFEFDGECLNGKATAKELELEDGDCIDVKIVK